MWYGGGAGGVAHEPASIAPHNNVDLNLNLGIVLRTNDLRHDGTLLRWFVGSRDS